MPKITDKDTARDLREYESEFNEALRQPMTGWVNRPSSDMDFSESVLRVARENVHKQGLLTSEHSEAIRASREPAWWDHLKASEEEARVYEQIFDAGARIRAEEREPQEDAYPLVSVLTAILAVLVVVAVGLWWWVR